MRSRSTLLMIGLLATLLVGTQLPASLTTNPLIIAEQVKIAPALFQLDDPESLVTVHVKFPEPYERNITDVDPSTVWLEGVIPPLNNWITQAPPEFVAQFDGNLVASIIWAKIYHMGATTQKKAGTPVKIELEISGNLFNGTGWQGIGLIKILMPEL
ncbi:MAG: hypothetical protein JSV58_01515 [Candidatus Bathyarchaeota archaeon]|nr:MAG: hypothetical protein JSV58_01515 [Candidatus Bathyarchaeota archaeon]